MVRHRFRTPAVSSFVMSTIMKIAKLCRLVVIGTTLVLGIGPAMAGNPCMVLLDPAIRHTNGVPIATSEPLRNGSMSWNCNPDFMGYCGGKYYWPCLESLRFYRVRAATKGCVTPYEHTYEWYAGQVCPPCEVESTFDGLEAPGFSNLGELPNGMLMPGAPTGAPSANSSRTQGLGR